MATSSSERWDILRIHVFVGGEDSVQRGPFLTARNNISVPRYRLYFEEYNVSDVKKERWTPQQLVSWLSQADIYIILGHIHQGIFNHLGWNVDDLKLQLEYLYWRNGFPSRDKLFCPVFLQDKFEYLRAIPDLCNPTLSIPLASGLACGGPLPDYYPYESLEPEITRYAVVFCRFTVHVVRITSHFPFRFMAANHEGKGWVVKAPYTTNCAFIRTCRTPQAVRSAVVKADELYGDLIPYVMLQPAMFSRAEDKIVFMRGKPCYVADKKLNPCKRSSVVARDDAIAFASQALKRLKAAVPSFLSDGLVRVDIFCTLSGKLVVNEFESLEAAFHCAASPQREDQVRAELVKYWANVLNRCLWVALSERCSSVK